MPSTDSTPYAYDVFISHGEADRSWVDEWLCPKLEKANVRVCVEYRDFMPGAIRIREIERAVEASYCTLLVFTPEYLHDEWKQLESNLGLRTSFGDTFRRADRNHRVIPLRLQPCEFPLSFRSLVELDFTDPTRHQAELERLIAAVRSRPSAAGPGPRRPSSDERWADGVAQSLAWEIHFGLPNRAYLEFVARYLLHLDPGQQLVDPFAPAVPDSHREDVHVVREDVEEEVFRWSHQIVMGPDGVGKTTLANRLADSLKDKALVVRWSPDKSVTGVGEESTGLFTIPWLAHRVFSAYIKRLLGVQVGRASPPPRLRRDRDWMEKLRWFYQVYRPRLVEPPADFELMAWLQSATPSSGLSSPEDALLALIDFIVQQYEQIVVLMDGPRFVHGRAVDQIIPFVQTVGAMKPERLQLKWFLNDADAEWIARKLDVVRQGRIALYRLPRWRDTELRELLYRRLMAWQRGEYAWEYDSATLLPDNYLDPAAKAQFVEIIIEGATRVYKRGRDKENDDRFPKVEGEGGLDAPLHALRLARGLVAACGGCLGQRDGATSPYKQPLGVLQFRDLVEHYWVLDEQPGGEDGNL